MKAEIIVKQTYQVVGTGSVERRVPVTLILGNRVGLRQLGTRLLEIAERKPKRAHMEWDPDDHQHLPTKYQPFNPELSDELEFRIGILTKANRKAVLKKYSIRKATRVKGLPESPSKRK